MTCSARSTSLALLLLASSAAAQDATSTALFKQGKELAAQGNYKEACPKFEASYKREEALGTLMNMADCHEKIGLVARAWSEWGAAYEKARKAQGEEARADLSKRRQDALEPRLPKLKVTVAGAATDLSVWRDERALDALEYDVELPVDPGTHVVTVRRGDEVLERQEQTLVETQRAGVTVDLAKIAAAHPMAQPSSSTAPPPPPPSPIAADKPSSRPWQLTAGQIATVTGAVVLVTGVAFEGGAQALKNNHTCVAREGQATLCTDAGLDKINLARAFAGAGAAFMIAGGATLAAGLLLWIFAPSAPKTGAAIAPIPGGAMLAWERVF